MLHAGEPTYIVIWDWDKMGRDGRARDPQDVTFVTVAKLVQDLHAAAGVPFASAELLQVL